MKIIKGSLVFDVMNTVVYFLSSLTTLVRVTYLLLAEDFRAMFPRWGQSSSHVDITVKDSGPRLTKYRLYTYYITNTKHIISITSRCGTRVCEPEVALSAWSHARLRDRVTSTTGSTWF